MRVLFPRAQIVAVEAPLPAIKCLPTDAEATAGPRRISAIEVIEQHPLQPPLRCPAATLPEARQLARLGKFTPSDFAHPDTLQSVTNHSERAQRLATLVDGDVLARVVAEINLTRARNFLFGIEQKFFPLRNPTGRAGNGEEHREHGHGETHGLINETGIEVHVGIELALDEVVVLKGDALALKGNFEQGVLAHKVEDFVSDALDDARARIVMLVDTMAEAHQLGFARLYLLDELRNFLDRADFHEHAKDFFVGAAVERTIERRNGRGRGGVRIQGRR